MSMEVVLATTAAARAAPVTYDDEFKLRAITLAESYGSLSRAAKELGISKSTLSRWSNNQHVGDEIVVAAKEISREVKANLTEHTQTLASKVLVEIENRFEEGAYSSYELIMLFGIVSDKHVNFKKMSSLDDAKNVEVHWPDIKPMSREDIELERSRVRLEHEQRLAAQE